MITYCIIDKDTNQVKIGKTQNIKKRLDSMQTDSSRILRVYGTIEGDHEKELHKKYKYLRMGGEWFKIAPELLKEFNCKIKIKSYRDKFNQDLILVSKSLIKTSTNISVAEAAECLSVSEQKILDLIANGYLKSQILIEIEDIEEFVKNHTVRKLRSNESDQHSQCP